MRKERTVTEAILIPGRVYMYYAVASEPHGEPVWHGWAATRAEAATWASIATGIAAVWFVSDPLPRDDERRRRWAS